MKSKFPDIKRSWRRFDRGRRSATVLPDHLVPADHRHLQPGLEQRIQTEMRLEGAGVVEDDRRVLQLGAAAEAEDVPGREDVGEVMAGHRRDRRVTVSTQPHLVLPCRRFRRSSRRGARSRYPGGA